jgi:KDO2-lipid IV(A) lauroyltransferase
LALFKALNKGAALVFLIDLAVSDGEVVSFMSKPAYTSFTTASFALKADALFLPHFSMRNPDRESLRVEIGTVIGHSEAITMTKKAAKTLRQRITADLGNWLWSHCRWKHTLSSECNQLIQADPMISPWP